MKRGRLICLMTLLAFNAAHAESGGLTVYYQRHSEGWFWYEDPEPEPAADPEETEADKPERADPVATLAAFRARLERAKARAILAPSDENLETFLRLNQLAMARAGDFAQAWQRVVWTTPALDSRLIEPVNDQAVQVANDQKLRRVDRFLLETARTHGLFFFFKGTCPFCHKFAPVLRGFCATARCVARRHRLLPVSTASSDR